MIDQSPAIISLDAIPLAAVETLLDHAFGTDRRHRTAYRIRAGELAIAALSFAAVDRAGVLLGSIQTWPVVLACDNGPRVPMIMVGPVAVEPAVQRDGLGQRLMHRALAAAEASGLPGHDALMLIGDPEYYARFFGFTAERTGAWRLPGPVEPHRLLARGAGVPGCSGMLGPRR